MYFHVFVDLCSRLHSFFTFKSIELNKRRERAEDETHSSVVAVEEKSFHQRNEKHLHNLRQQMLKLIKKGRHSSVVAGEVSNFKSVYQRNENHLHYLRRQILHLMKKDRINHGHVASHYKGFHGYDKVHQSDASKKWWNKL